MVSYPGPVPNYLLPKACPTCRSPEPETRYGHRLTILVDGISPPAIRCADAWHGQQVPGASPADFATSGPYEIRGGEVVGPNLRVILDHVIELLHMRHEDDPQGLPTVSMIGAIGELVGLLNGAYDQGRRSPR
jgi:hypothetical protein